VKKRDALKLIESRSFSLRMSESEIKLLRDWRPFTDSDKVKRRCRKEAKEGEEEVIGSV